MLSHTDTANKIGTSFSNGDIALWDIEKEGPAKLGPQFKNTAPLSACADMLLRLDVMHQHDRAVNQVLFGGPTGNYLLSAGQDGNIKLWVRLSHQRM